jgi:hypothetical protein
LVPTSGGNGFGIYSDTPGSEGLKLVIKPGGQVGIGTAGPTVPLDVVGNVDIDGDLEFQGSQTIGVTTGDLTVAPGGASNTGDFIVNPGSNGNFKVNNEDGSGILDIEGQDGGNALSIVTWSDGGNTRVIDGSSERFRLMLINTGSKQMNFQDAGTPYTAHHAVLDIGGYNVQKTGAGSPVVEKISGISIIPSHSGESGLTLTDTSGIRISNAASPTGGMTNLYGIYIEDITRASNDYGIFVAGADTAGLIINDSNVGINTTTPAQTLTVQGTLNVTADGSAGPNLFVASDGNVGIGTDDPEATYLHVGPGTHSGTDREMMLATSSGNAIMSMTANNVDASLAGLHFRQDGAKDGHFGLWRDAGTTDQYRLVMEINAGGVSDSSNKFVMLTDGKIGIGTNVPNELLTLQGGSDAPVLMIAQANNVDAGYQLHTSNARGMLTFSYDDTSSSTPHVYFTNAGKVGIGAADPTEKLVVMGNMTVNMTGGEFGADIKVNGSCLILSGPTTDLEIC